MKSTKYILFFCIIVISSKSFCMQKPAFLYPELNNEPFAPRCIGEEFLEDHNAPCYSALHNSTQLKSPTKAFYFTPEQTQTNFQKHTNNKRLRLSNETGNITSPHLLQEPLVSNITVPVLSTTQKQPQQLILEKNNPKKRFSCSLCSYSCDYYSRCTSHIKISHLKIIAYSCSSCDKKSFQKSLIKKHIQKSLLCRKAVLITDNHAIEWGNEIATLYVA